MRVVLAAAVVVASFPTTAAAADLTPDGPVTLTQTSTYPGPAIGYGPRVVTGWQVEVAEGGRAGTVRPRFGSGDQAVVGDSVELPAAPGTYTFPAPHRTWTGAPLGLVQTTGGHAIVQRSACRPDQGAGGDPCQNLFVDIFRDGPPDERVTGAQLAVKELFEPDADRDLRGDTTEDRTDLRVSTAPAREADGRLRVEVRVTNAGPLAADTPWLTAPALSGGRWEGACLPHVRYPNCLSTPLAAGETLVFVVRADAPEATSATVNVSSEGADLAPADNAAGVEFAAAPAFDLVATAMQKLSKGVKVQVRGVRAGNARVTVAFKVRGRTVRVARSVKLAPYTARTLTVHPAGVKLRSLKRALKRGPVNAEITVRTLGGKSPVTAKTVVR